MRTTTENTTTVIPYGPHDAQVVECRSSSPEAGPCRGIAVLVHGGYWRARFDASLMAALAEDLVARGWATANVEYRRGGNGGSWPTTLDDVHAALHALARHDWRQGTGGPLIGIGHSVGGQLALLGAGRLDAVVALAPVTDVVRTHREDLGEGAAAEFFGAAPEERPEAYAEASPLQQLPVGVPTLLVHGASDTRVPLTHSLDYVARAHRAGDPMDLLVRHDLDHLAAIDPTAAHWGAVLDWMSRTAQDHQAADASTPPAAGAGELGSNDGPNGSSRDRPAQPFAAEAEASHG
ncbi:putative lipase/esterase [Kocuria dechangensis]|uniref:Lipase/esterase n=1 Tax=Kocuria dechangensis TaxID=1176249 RepID=A0A917LNJ8_9MICC|nr:alpha/beta fold hydrolase [Kocuria dechangensis]GGG47237.1 putative lipase/esterase [Kocuria dechangensis]